MNTYKIQDSEFNGETFTIGEVKDLTNCTPALAADLEVHGKEPKLYIMDRTIEGTRKKAYSIHCFRHFYFNDLI